MIEIAREGVRLVRPHIEIEPKWPEVRESSASDKLLDRMQAPLVQ